MKLTQRIELDFAGESIPKIVFAKQGDSETRFVEIIPTAHGQILPREEGVTARLRMTKPDGHVVLNDAVLSEDGKITVELTGQALSSSGRATAEIGLYKGDALLSSQVFFVQIRPTAYPKGAPESSDEYGSLTNALSEAEKAVENAKNALTEAEKAVEIANTAESNMESTVQAAKEAKQDAEAANTAATAAGESAADAKNSAERAEKSAEDAKNSAEGAKAAVEKAFQDRGDPRENADEITTPGTYAGEEIEGTPSSYGTLLVFSCARHEEWTAQLFFGWDTQKMYFRIFDPVHATKGTWKEIG